MMNNGGIRKIKTISGGIKKEHNYGLKNDYGENGQFIINKKIVKKYSQSFEKKQSKWLSGNNFSSNVTETMSFQNIPKKPLNVNNNYSNGNGLQTPLSTGRK